MFSSIHKFPKDGQTDQKSSVWVPDNFFAPTNNLLTTKSWVGSTLPANLWTYDMADK